MSKKKNDKQKELSEQEKINRRVDAMLDPKLPDSPPDKAESVPPLDIFKGAKTAPELSGKLIEKVDKDLDKSDEAPVPAKHVAPKPAASTPAAADPPTDPVTKQDPLDDEATDKAVTDIAAKEGNTLLALQDVWTQS